MLRICMTMTVLTVLCLGRGLAAQEAAAVAADPAARAALESLVKRYREAPTLTLKTTMKLTVSEGQSASREQEIKAEFTHRNDGAAVARFRGFTCWVKDGMFHVVHESSEKDSYYVEEVDGSPFWSFFMNFQDLPFPELALFWGEDDLDELCMQLHPRSTEIVPTSVESVTINGRETKKLVLSSPGATLAFFIDPESRLIRSIEHELSGPPFAREGAKITSIYTYETDAHNDQPLDDSVFTFNIGDRQRVDAIGSLLPAPVEREIGNDEDDDAPIAAPAGDLVGKPAPPFILATADGKAVDLNDLRGQAVVLDFWATWCGPCRVGLPLLHQVDTWADEHNIPVVILTVNVWEARGAQDTPDNRLKSATDFWTKQQFTLPILMDYTDQTAGAYGVSGIPTTVIIRPDGVVHDVHVGVAQVERLQNDIAEAIKAGAAAQ